MRTVTYRLADLNRVTILLGFRGENEHTRVYFDCQKTFEEYPGAIPSLAVIPPQGEPYPAVVVRDGDYVYWDVLDSDVAYHGNGSGQLTFAQDSKVKKTYEFKTKIDKSIMPTGPKPKVIDDWITEANTVLGEIPGTIAGAVDDALAEAKASGEFDGPQGPEGPAGADGKDGAPGRDGKDGADGAPGRDGADGKDGADGAPGADGTTFTPSVSSEGVISWTNDGNRQNPSPVNIKGPAGPAGADGQQGPAGRDGQDATPDLIAAAYEDLTYPVSAGTLCYKGEVLYRAKQDIPTSESWTAGHWDATTVADELSRQYGAINVSQPTATSEDIGKFLKLKAIGQDGKPTEFEYGEGGGVLPDDLPTDETAQELLEYEGYNTGLTDTALMVIGMLFDNLPRDETAIDILRSLELECERLELIYNGWIAERESA